MDLTAPRRVCLDTSAAIYFLADPPGTRRRLVVEPYVRAAEQGSLTLVVSTVAVAELLVQPIRLGDRGAEIAVRLLLELCEVADVTRAVAERAADFRARYGLPTPDALICSTAVTAGCDLVVGNDQRWHRVQEITFRSVD